MIGYEGYGSATATKSGGTGTTPALTIPANATGAVVIFDTGDDSGPEASDTVTFGGEACTNVAFDTSNGAVTSGGGIWWCPDIRGRADDVVRYYSSNGGNVGVRVVYFSANVPLLRDVNAYTSKYNGGNSWRYQNSDASLPVEGANQLAVVFAYQYSGNFNNSVGSAGLLQGGGTKGLTADLGGADEAVSAGLYTSGGSFWGWYLGLTVYESVVIHNVAPDPLTPVLDLNPGAIAFQGAQAFYGSPMRAMELSLNPGRIGSQAKRQVALVGPDAASYRFTPEMTQGGNEGDLLTQHANRPATWEAVDSHVHSRRWVPMVFRPDPVADPDDWQILHDDDGSVMMTWVED